MDAKDWYYGRRTAMHIDTQNDEPTAPYTFFAEIGDVLSLHLLRSVNVVEPTRRCFGIRLQSEHSHQLRGMVSHVWTVHHANRVDDPAFEDHILGGVDARDRRISELLEFRTYASLSGRVAVEIPEVVDGEHNDLQDDASATGPHKKRRVAPEVAAAMKQRQSAIRKKNGLLDQAWESWEEPFLQSGHFVALLRPCFIEGAAADEKTHSNTLCFV